MTRALILGIGGMDGSYLADILLERGYEVHGLYRRSSVDNLQRIAHCRDKVTLHQGDMGDAKSIDRVICFVMPHEIYNVADQDHVQSSFAAPGYSMDITAGAVMRTLESVRLITPQTKFFQPISATIFGDAPGPQTLDTPLNPLTPYACAKASALHIARYYRQVHGMHVVTAILYNHDSPRRGPDYFLQKICRQAVEVSRGLRDYVEVYDPSARLDIGYAKDYMEQVVECMGRSDPKDLLIGTGNPWLVEDYVAAALSCLELTPTDYKVIEGGRPANTLTPSYILQGHILQGTSMRNLIRMIVDSWKEKLG